MSTPGSWKHKYLTLVGRMKCLVYHQLSPQGGVRQVGREAMGVGVKEEAALGPCARFRVLPLFTLFFHGTSVVGKSEVTPRAKARDPPRKLMSKLEQYERAV